MWPRQLLHARGPDYRPTWSSEYSILCSTWANGVDAALERREREITATAYSCYLWTGGWEFTGQMANYEGFSVRAISSRDRGMSTTPQLVPQTEVTASNMPGKFTHAQLRVVGRDYTA